MGNEVTKEIQGRSLEHQLGYLVASMQEMKGKIDQNTKTTKDLCYRIKKVEENISTAKTVVRTIKFIGGAILLVVTLKLGSIAALYKNYFS